MRNTSWQGSNCAAELLEIYGMGRSFGQRGVRCIWVALGSTRAWFPGVGLYLFGWLLVVSCEHDAATVDVRALGSMYTFWTCIYFEDTSRQDSLGVKDLHFPPLVQFHSDHVQGNVQNEGISYNPEHGRTCTENRQSPLTESPRA